MDPRPGPTTTDDPGPHIDILSLGTLHDAVLAFSRQTSVASYWDSVALNARWVVPARSVCILRPDSANRFSVATRVAQGRSLPPMSAPFAVGNDVVGRMVRSPTPMWVDDLDVLDSDDFRRWLASSHQYALHSVPVVGPTRRLGVMLLDFPRSQESSSQARVTALASLYARHAASTYRIIKSTINLESKNLELERAQQELLQATERITELNSSLEQRIEERTRELEDARLELLTKNDELRHLALHDELTGVANRTLFGDRVEGLIRRSGRTEEVFAVLLLDGVAFKQINDTYGHHVGDLVLQKIATRTQEVLRETDTVARMGGDEFAVILAGLNPEAVPKVTEKIINAVEQPVSVDRGDNVTPRLSIGIAVFPQDGRDLDQLLRRADEAMYQAKRQEKSWTVASRSTTGRSRRRTD